MSKWKVGLVIITICSFFIQQAQAQYFGRNKPRYENFDFQVTQTPHFEIYHYLQKNPERLQEIASWSEQWYRLHQAVLLDTFTQLNPLILYNNHADFQQTNAISGQISVGTGGVTEGLKNRVVMPIAASNQQTHHVLGHELVHAFQYHMILGGDSTSLKNLANLPLWMVEGLAEYMSIGRVDAHTAMWMRDAVIQDDVPSIKDLQNPKYFPYRYGQAFWAFVTGYQGDEVIRNYFMKTAMYGQKVATDSVFNMSMENLSELWVSTLKNYYGQYVRDKKENFIGEKLITKDNSGRMNFAPVISPNGRYAIFLSEKNLFSTDLFLADARTGEILRTVASSTRSSHVDDFDYIESAGTWSPDSKKFAFTAYSKGKNILIIKDVFTGKTLEEFEVKGVSAFSNPDWSPDGKKIVISGIVNGQTDLYIVDVKTKKVEQLTNDRYSELLPKWSNDGSKIVFSTDQVSLNGGRKNGEWKFNLAVRDMTSGRVENITIFPGADNLNPIWDNQDNIIFLSNRDGFRNMYKYEVATGKVFQLTDFITGISGITHYAPAISASRTDNRYRVLYTHYWDNGYTIHRATDEDFLNKEVDPNAVDMSPAELPRINKEATDVVNRNLNALDRLAGVPKDSLTDEAYKAKFKLDYIGGSAGVGVGNVTGLGTVTGAAGGVDLLFSDILGNNQLFTSLALNGEVFDFGGVVAYVNQKNRIGWGASISHIPYRTGRYGYAGIDTVQFKIGDDILGFPAYHYVLDNIRTFEDKIGVFAQYAFSQSVRVEAGASYSFYNNRVDRFDNYYDAYGRLIAQEREKLDPEKVGLNLFSGQLATINAALVGDNSYFGIASPLSGWRYRLGIERYIGDINTLSATADYRRYVRTKPATFAFRALHYGRYGKDKNFFPIFIGQPWFVRGYNFNDANEILPLNNRSVNDLIGSKVVVSNFEVRVPFTGPEQLSLIRSNFLFTELNFFVDGGLAFDDFSEFNATGSEGQFNVQPKPLFSAGASLRINLFGALILEPYYAFPLLKDTKGVFGLNIVPGW